MFEESTPLVDGSLIAADEEDEEDDLNVVVLTKTQDCILSTENTSDEVDTMFERIAMSMSMSDEVPSDEESPTRRMLKAVANRTKKETPKMKKMRHMAQFRRGLKQALGEKYKLCLKVRKLADDGTSLNNATEEEVKEERDKARCAKRMKGYLEAIGGVRALP